METSSSQRDLTSGLNKLPADKKVWTKPTVEMISRDTIATGMNHNKNEGTQRSNGYGNFTIGLYVS